MIGCDTYPDRRGRARLHQSHFIIDGEIGPDLFRAACRMDLEGIVSKHRGRAYSGGKCKHWIKMKNRAHPARHRVRDARLATRP